MRIVTKTTVRAFLLGTVLSFHQPALAQETEAAVESEAAALFSPEDLDNLMAPVALYPDSLLAQVLLATTYPVDVLKADRFLTKNADLESEARSALAADQDWPDPIRELTAGFPELIARMAEHIDWTEQTGNAVMAQTDDVIASLQRLRAQAKLNGYLVDNEAMTVEEDAETGSITISSANPEVVYVPQYTETVYTQPAPATPVYVTDDDDWDDVLATGAIVWGSAIIIDEIFDDDDWGDDWNWGYGGGGDNDVSIDWDGDINIDNGINIGNGSGNDFDRPGIGERPGIGGGDLGLGNLERPTTLPARVPGKLGEVDPDRLQSKRDGTFKPSDASRDAAREKIANTKVSKDKVAKLPATTGKRDLGVAKDGNKPSIKLPQKPKAAATKDRTAKAVPKNLAKPKKPSTPKAATSVKKTKKAPVYLPSTGNRGTAASQRGNKSLKGLR
jgi:hypothetical protein